MPIEALVQTIGGEDVVWHIYTHSRDQDIIASISRLFADHTIRLMDYGENRGLSKSVNEGLEDAYQTMRADVVIVPNDDIIISRADFDKLAQACVDHPDCGLVFCNGYDQKHEQVEDLKFSVFGINRPALDRIGYFDENLPDYFCDCDYRWRSVLAGMPVHHVDTDIIHLGSATLDAVPALREQLQRTFPADSAYFCRKWGGEPYHETFDHPFNDPALSYFIAADSRANPYPAYRRSIEDLTRL